MSTNTKPLRTKLSQLREFMAAGDWRAALRLANSFGNLGTMHAAHIQRAWAAIQSPEFYREIGRDPDSLVAAGIVALRERYGNPEQNFTDGEFK